MRRISVVLSVCLLFALLAAPVAAQDETILWPTNGWATSTPEAQGMDSAALAALPQRIADEKLNIHSVLVIRNGYLVMEAYHFPYTADMQHNIYSSTKSVTSALVGIAIDQEFMEGVDQPILDFFPDRTIANLDAVKESITLENVLTMSSGLEWTPDNMDMTQLNAEYNSLDWVQYTLDKPMADPPGTHFVYNSGGSHLLAAAVEQATGQDLLTFAHTNLFDPLGITSADWFLIDPHGTPFGGTGLRMTPRDMAKFGYLYLHNGEWDGQQIISSAWVTASTQSAIPTRPITDGYGYQWWVDSKGYYMTAGYGGQHIMVDPAQNLVVVFTSGLGGSSEVLLPVQLLTNIILPAIQSDDPLPENAEGQAALAAAIQTLDSAPAPTAVEPLPTIAADMAERVYQMDDNAIGWDSIQLTFTEDADTAQITLNGIETTTIGLDGVLRVTTFPEANTNVIFASGRWVSDKRFEMNYARAGGADNFQVTFTFDGDTLKVLHKERATGQIVTLTGEAS